MIAHINNDRRSREKQVGAIIRSEDDKEDILVDAKDVNLRATLMQEWSHEIEICISLSLLS